MWETTSCVFPQVLAMASLKRPTPHGAPHAAKEQSRFDSSCQDLDRVVLQPCEGKLRGQPTRQTSRQPASQVVCAASNISSQFTRQRPYNMAESSGNNKSDEDVKSNKRSHAEFTENDASGV